MHNKYCTFFAMQWSKIKHQMTFMRSKVMIFVGSTFDHGTSCARFLLRDIGGVSVKIESDIIFPPTPCPESFRGVVRGGFNRD